MKMKSNFKKGVSLDSLAPGQAGRGCEGPEREIPLRLQDLGFVPGTRLVVRRKAPMGNPVEVELRGYRLCLRTEQLSSVVVEIEGENE